MRLSDLKPASSPSPPTRPGSRIRVDRGSGLVVDGWQLVEDLRKVHGDLEIELPVPSGRSTPVPAIALRKIPAGTELSLAAPDGDEVVVEVVELST